MEASEIDDCFDSLLNVEDSFITEGRNKGVTYGEQVGFEDGRLLGLEKGFEFGEELGNIYGFTLFCKNIIAIDPNKYSQR